MHKYFVPSLALALVACAGTSESRAAPSLSGGDAGQGHDRTSGGQETGQSAIASGPGFLRIAVDDHGPVNPPMHIKLYPGADVQTSKTAMHDGKSGTMVVFKTPDSVEKVIKFYRNELRSNNIAFTKEIRSGDTRTIGGDRTSGEGLHVSVTGSADGMTTATIVVSGAS